MASTDDKDSLIHKPEGSTVNPDLSRPLPTEVRVANNPQERKYGSDGTFKDMVATGAAGGSAEVMSSRGGGQNHSAEYYEQWRKDTQGKIDKGEDYYADFARRARERSNQSSVTGRLVTGLRSKFGKDKDKEKAIRQEDDAAGSVEVGGEDKARSKLFGKKKEEPLDVIR